CGCSSEYSALALPIWNRPPGTATISIATPLPRSSWYERAWRWSRVTVPLAARVADSNAKVRSAGAKAFTRTAGSPLATGLSATAMAKSSRAERRGIAIPTPIATTMPATATVATHGRAHSRARVVALVFDAANDATAGAGATIVAASAADG